MSQEAEGLYKIVEDKKSDTIYLNADTGVTEETEKPDVEAVHFLVGDE